MGFNIPNVDSGTPIGQLTILLFAVAMVLINLKSTFSGAKEAWKNRSARSLTEENRNLKQEASYTRIVNRNLVEHQITSKEAIRSLRLQVIDCGENLSPRTIELLDSLKEIELRSHEDTEIEDES